MIFEDLKKSDTGSSRLRKLDFSLCSRCYTLFRHPCETISLSKFNANTVQIRQPHCWGPIKGHKAAQLLLIREGRQTGLSRCPFFALSVISFVVPGGRKGGKGKEVEGRGGRGRGVQIRTLCRSIHTGYLALVPGGDVYATQNLLSTLALHALIVCHLTIRPTDLQRQEIDRHLSPVCSWFYFFFFFSPSPPSSTRGILDRSRLVAGPANCITGQHRRIMDEE